MVTVRSDDAEVRAFVSDAAVPATARFVVARLREALSRSTPLAFSACAHNDPRIVVRDLAAAIDWMRTETGDKRRPWALLVPRLRRVRDVLRHDQAMRRWYDHETSAFLAAYALLPGNPKPSDWPSAETVLTKATRDLRDALLHQTTGYRPQLSRLVAVACQRGVSSSAAMRRLDERAGLLAAMLVDEGRDADDVIQGLVRRLRQAPRDKWERAAQEALSGGWREYQVAVAAVGVLPDRWPGDSIAGTMSVSLRHLIIFARQGWPLRILAEMLLRARLLGADSMVLARMRARDDLHAVRLGRALAARAADHQGTTAPARRIRLLPITAVRERNTRQVRLLTRPAGSSEIPISHRPVVVRGAMSYMRRAALSESDVERLLFGWIGIESLGIGGRPSAQAAVARDLPALAWLLAARNSFVYPYELLTDVVRSADWGIVQRYVRPSEQDWDERWLDLLADEGPADAQSALAAVLDDCDPLTTWRVREARERLLNGRLLVQQLNRHRRETSWTVARVREARNTIAHRALADVEQMSVAQALGRDDQLPTDARFLGRAAVAVLGEVGRIAAHRLTDQPGQVRTFDGYLARAVTFVASTEARAKSSTRGTRFQTRAPALP